MRQHVTGRLEGWNALFWTRRSPGKWCRKPWVSTEYTVSQQAGTIVGRYSSTSTSRCSRHGRQTDVGGGAYLHGTCWARTSPSPYTKYRL